MDARRRALVRAAAVGGRDEVIALARYDARCGDDALAYVALWSVDAERADLGARLGAEQHAALSALDLPHLRVATSARDWPSGRRLWGKRWAWKTVARWSGEEPVLAIETGATRAKALASVLASVPTLAYVKAYDSNFLASAVEPSIEKLRALGSIHFGAAPRPEHASVFSRLPSLVHVALRLSPGQSLEQVEALALFPHLEVIELLQHGLNAEALDAVARSPCLRWLSLAESIELPDQSAQGLLAKHPRLAVLAPRRLERRLGRTIAQDLRPLLKLHATADSARRERAHRAAREISAAPDPAAAHDVIVGLLDHALRERPTRETLRLASNVRREGASIAPLLVQLSEITRDAAAAPLHGAANRLIACAALSGTDLSSIESHLNDAQRRLRRLQQELPLAATFSLRERDRRPSYLSPVYDKVCSALERHLLGPLAEVRRRGVQLVERALTEGRLPRTRETLDFVVAAGAHDAAALALVSPLVHSGYALAATALVELAERLEDDPANAGAGLWAAARRGADLAPVLALLNAPDERWDRAGASPNLLALLEQRGAEERLPSGVSTTRKHAPDDEEHHPNESGHSCGACGSKRTRCLFNDAYGSNAGGSEEWEHLCDDCGLYTYSDRDWG